jgi:hypothetical protein
MRVWTYEEVRDRVLKDLDLEDEDFVQPDEMVGYCNEAIDEAEAEIHKIHEDYFLTSSAITMVANQATGYSLPADIYANKIRKLVYANGSVIYEVPRLRGTKIFQQIAEIAYAGSNEDYSYFLKNADADTGVKLFLTPVARESGAYLTLWYLRNANRVPLIADGSLAATEAAKIDIPEFVNFVIQWMKVRCYEKDMDPRLEAAISVLQQQRKMMVETLTGMVVDDDDTIPMDTSFYDEMS